MKASTRVAVLAVIDEVTSRPFSRILKACFLGNPPGDLFVVAHIYRVIVYVSILRIYRTSPYPSHFSGYGLLLSKTVKDPWY